MNYISFDITSDEISLVTDTMVARLIISHGLALENNYIQEDVNSTSITITKSNLNLSTLDNTYFKVEVFDMQNNSKPIGLYYIDIINEKEKNLFNANNLKQTLDNLNYYEGIIESLTIKENFLEANDFFYNYINYLSSFFGKSFLEFIKPNSNCNDNN